MISHDQLSLDSLVDDILKDRIPRDDMDDESAVCHGEDSRSTVRPFDPTARHRVIDEHVTCHQEQGFSKGDDFADEVPPDVLRKQPAGDYMDAFSRLQHGESPYPRASARIMPASIEDVKARRASASAG